MTLIGATLTPPHIAGPAATPRAQPASALRTSPPAATAPLAAQQPAAPIAPKLTIELDRAAARFVQVLIDPASDAVLRRYPSEGQLAFSRGVNAYMVALGRAQTD